jgi:GntR family transcriptional repressor for pyruvate dehydrogenase complex
MLPRVEGRVRLADQVADMLTEEIRSGRLGEGDRLPTEVQLVEQLGVSRTVVREAVSRLRSTGLVEPRQGSGVFVKAAGAQPLSFEPAMTATKGRVLQIAEVRRALEAEAAALAAVRHTPEDLAAIWAAAERLDAAVAAGGDGVAEDLAFHLSIAEATGNPFMIATLRYLSQFMFSAISVTRANEARRKDFADDVQAEHVAVIEAIASGDAETAREVARQHMANAASRLERADPAFWSEADGARVSITDPV